MAQAQTQERPQSRTGKAVKPLVALRTQLDSRRDAIAEMLPPEVPVDKFISAVMTAVSKDKKGDLLRANRLSLFTACMDAALDGLVPDGREGALVVFGEKVDGQWQKFVQWMPMVGGIIKAILADGGVSKMSAHVVYEKDDFYIEQGAFEQVRHKLSLEEDRGDIRGVYAIAHINGAPDPLSEWMTVGDVEKVRSASKSPNGPAWNNWWGEMARKSVVKRQSKYLPLKERARGIIERDNEREFAFDNQETNGPPVIEQNGRPVGAARLDHFGNGEAKDDTSTEVDDEPEPRFFAVDHQGQAFPDLSLEDYVTRLTEFLGACESNADVTNVWEGSMGMQASAVIELRNADAAKQLRDAYEAASKGANTDETQEEAAE